MKTHEINDGIVVSFRSPLEIQPFRLSGYNGGLFVVTLENVPTACGAWPAFWMFGDDAQHAWPRWGEYDILDTWRA